MNWLTGQRSSPCLLQPRQTATAAQQAVHSGGAALGEELAARRRRSGRPRSFHDGTGRAAEHPHQGHVHNQHAGGCVSYLLWW